MREAQFLKQNADKWKQYEQELHGLDNPDVFAERFVELTDDLAYARTFYAGSNTTNYLNGLTSRFHQKIYRNKKEKKARIWTFWQFELPWLFHKYQRQLLYSFLLFVAFVCIGVLSAKYDESFVRLILSDAYVNMTNENIEKGDPFGVYRKGDEITMFVMIALNNIYVAFLMFVTGISAGVFTVVFLLQNGIMLGAFEYYFFKHGVGWSSILAVFIHGTIEISVVIVAGCAGLVLANSLVFPKTFSRWHSLLKGARDAMKITFGLVPFFIVAAFFEGFVTRHYKEMPTALKISILVASLALILWYFVFYPIYLHKKIERAQHDDENLSNDNFQLWLNQKLSSES